MNEMLRYTIIRVILFVMGGFLVLGCSDEDDVGNSGGTSKYGLIRMAEEDYDSSNTSYILAGVSYRAEGVDASFLFS